MFKETKHLNDSSLIIQNEISLAHTLDRYPFPQMGDALANVPNLHTITVPEGMIMNPPNMKMLAKNRSLKKIWIALSKHNISPEFITMMEGQCASAHFRGLAAPKLPLVLVFNQLSHISSFSLSFSFRVKEQPHVALPSNPLYIPLQNVSTDVQDRIWGRILQFTIDTDPRPYMFGGSNMTFSLSIGYPYLAYKRVPMVSKTFRVSHPVIHRIYIVH